MRQLVFCFWLIWVAGWVKCIVHLSECDFQAPYKAEVIYGVSIFTSIGGITGWMDFGK